MAFNLTKFFVKKWVTLRLAAQEFGFKKPFEIAEEYSTMKSVIFFSLVPIELVFIFTYARIHGSLQDYSLLILLSIALINIITANLIINPLKDSKLINETISQYEQMDYDKRKAIYSLKNGVSLSLILILLLPWIIFAISIAIVCAVIPR